MIEILLYGMACAVCGYAVAFIQYSRKLKSRSIKAWELAGMIENLNKETKHREAALQAEIQKLKGTTK